MMSVLNFKSRNSFNKNEIARSAFLLLFDSGFSKKILKKKIILKDLKNLDVSQNTCFVTNKRFSIFKSYRLSRIAFRNRVGLGLLSGIRRSV